MMIIVQGLGLRIVDYSNDYFNKTKNSRNTHVIHTSTIITVG